MSLFDLISRKKATILRRWFDAIVSTYSPEASDFLRKEGSQFANPVRHTIQKGMDILLSELVRDSDFSEFPPLLYDVIRIRAVQGFAPSQSISFILLLKGIVREEIKSQISKGQFDNELLQLESKIDNLALRSFDAYMECREKIYGLKLNELTKNKPPAEAAQKARL
ncbi:RsbRD N-terminal domain-containing protein [Thermodesulfovibrionales bacterium]|nr:RsbRD N-terminal domain-containing protein [Thermodesulfovibrionales bacterium]MCL0042645.1 RsbRD N-terminal domain-containing protein [Thermodesulfovibrionales bacterium]MCL0051862.1 RsbRD N-terminal domain-containing protein [Thermodesulfovibrionales bacterium]MCL0071156.1 RsbRD N-terminal domain-containing protein [Thermodesulfovibrionales bacterium]MCL0086173.1 RsbRD N-terminal domain-containing protein [Thermodesulfovibrionales bacterium]